MKEDISFKVSSFNNVKNNSDVAFKCLVEFFTSKQQIFFLFLKMLNGYLQLQQCSKYGKNFAIMRNAQSCPKHYNVIYFKIFMNLAVF